MKTIELTELEKAVRKRNLIQEFIQEHREALYSVALARLGAYCSAEKDVLAEKLKEIDRDNLDDCSSARFHFLSDNYIDLSEAAGKTGNFLEKRVFSKTGCFDLYFLINVHSTPVVCALADALIFLLNPFEDLPAISYFCKSADEIITTKGLFNAFDRAKNKAYDALWKAIAKSETQKQIWRAVYSRVFVDYSTNYPSAILHQKLEKCRSIEQGELHFFYSDEKLYHDSLLAYQYLPDIHVFSSDGGFALPHGIATQDKQVLAVIGEAIADIINQNPELPSVDYLVEN